MIFACANDGCERQGQSSCLGEDREVSRPVKLSDRCVAHQRLKFAIPAVGSPSPATNRWRSLVRFGSRCSLMTAQEKKNPNPDPAVLNQ